MGEFEVQRESAPDAGYNIQFDGTTIASIYLNKVPGFANEPAVTVTQSKHYKTPQKTTDNCVIRQITENPKGWLIIQCCSLNPLLTQVQVGGRAK